MQKVLLGAEAIAQGAIDGGMSGVYAYPGTPSTEITEYIQSNKYAREQKLHSMWSTNEKTAMESALGMAYAGKRAMVCMKHVGLNVAADCFMNAAVTGVNGGMIVTVADDPSMHSSQNEQDSRYYGRFAQIPILEPSNQQEAYDMAYAAFDLSEEFGVPVMIRITTRLAHSRAVVQLSPVRSQNSLKLPDDPRQFVLLPNIARKQYRKLLAGQSLFEEKSNTSPFNQYHEGTDKTMGIIACGISMNYLMEKFPEGCPYPVVKVSQYPLPRKLVTRLSEETGYLLVLEEGYPIIEELIKGYLEKEQVKGRLDGTLPRDGELNPDHVAKALGLPVHKGNDVPSLVANRPPALCVGCSHHDVFKALNEALKELGDGRVFSDIGCYTMGALEPYHSINTCVDMGASITMAKGAADAGLIPAIALIGDSTFTHSGITGLLDAVVENSPITIIISDNESTSMTGGQESSAKGRIEAICEGVGVLPGHIHVVLPVKKNHESLVKLIKDELNYPGVSVIIPRRICVQKNRRDIKIKQVAKSI
ncbi:MAG TPA: indolepyruvate ferredoxin oxidoreductase [Marinilabiliales bacterium]|nr:MAG: indolepyruvate ferredoxin oxidoreductase [Bacteroidetes bacterium GWA2_40_14]OFX61050.1 MAG: indolepyruvate ferredoxin oxidoreductase [Bacteroidetes bacterium GWC2_40_13]OFX74993.1 MAG: indolepyruvate ferredoxin oxidoreductase [Bacteroidetes bacterium GWD2_40_43]OFX89672.1 MAG: indolepyruvate ferredoxin oxidoreductase [Bacteroidetes bacterium GWE2_40_63]OFY24189.1 MAG: indolepyruvate ferredoxin oxidoreductase [Bacteroidetes bacterium GWF2_40_13]OFZ26381.1 MAG: indolepyruvate ferredoxin